MKSTTDSISFNYLINDFTFNHRKAVKAFMVKKLKSHHKSVSAINYIFCNDQFLFNLNTSYLNHKTLTDIITFELSEKGEPLVADIYISIERVRENATKFQTSFKQELHRVLFHGILHLSGFTDKRPIDKTQMRSMEDKWLKQYLVPRETQFI